MSLVTLKYRLPEEQQEYEMAYNGALYKIVLTELDEELRRKYKYEDQHNIPIEEVRKLICDLLADRNLTLYE
jgi:hypothetical protein